MSQLTAPGTGSAAFGVADGARRDSRRARLSRPRHWLAVAAIVALSGCLHDKEPDPTRLAIQIDAGSDISPGANGQPSPVALRLYALKATTAFDQSDYFSLLDDDAEVLGDDMDLKEEVIIAPGESQALALEPSDDTVQLAVLAAFYDIDSAVWKATAPVVANALNDYTVTLSGNNIELTTGR